jgi:solute carrier family 13 (sodium-dependent dicarboxylate transporter), member 2/3/5
MQNFKKFIPLLGPVFALAIWLFATLPTDTKYLAGVMIWVVWWWLFTKIPLQITGMLGVSLSIILGVEKASIAYSSFAHPLIFLFMGGFFIAKAMEVTNFHKRIALNVLVHKLIDGNPQRIIIALMLLTAFFSMWISNTATISIILPIVLGVLSELDLDIDRKELIVVAMAYSATIGGLGTPIGSPPNMLAIGMLSSLANITVDFFDWMKWAFPILIVCMGILIYLVMKKTKLKTEKKIDTTFAQEGLIKLGPLHLKEKNIIFVLVISILGWLTPSLVGLFLGRSSELYIWLRAHMSEAVVVMIMTMFLFIFPLGEKKATLKWADATKIDWGTLLLFGSGISLGKMMFKTGLAKFVGDQFLGMVPLESPYMFVLALIIFSISFTEFASNTASANLLIPVVIITSAKFNMAPTIPVIATAIGCNLAFTLPVATPPNAIVYGTGIVRLKTMIRYGSGLNVICSGIIFIYLALFI